MSGDPVQEIKDRLSILDVVSPYVELHKAGKSYKGKSPFSAERTPSFYVSPERGMYYCFSTSQGGDVFTFVQTMEGVDFKGALRILAEKAGVALLPERPEVRTARERSYAALEAAASFYHTSLVGESAAQTYLAERGLRPATIDAWRIGYAPGPPQHGWRELKQALEADGYTTEELQRVGLVKQPDGGKDPFDVFRDRIVFPMCDPSGRVVAFSGRILHPHETAPKYVNSPETELYKKSELLFGFDKAKQGIRKLDFTLIVEGQFDVVMSHQAGYTNAVAVSGTALTEHHVQLIERLSDRVVLALDSDQAGVRAVKRAAELMLTRGLDVKVAELPEGQDPADLIVAGQDAFKQVVGQAVHVIDFLLHVLQRAQPDARQLRQQVTREITPFILLLPSRVEQYSFAETIAHAVKVPTDVIWHEIERALKRHSENPSAIEVPESEPSVTAHSADSGEGVIAWLAALRGVQSLLSPTAAAQLETQVAPLAIAAPLPTVPEEELARAIFTFEADYASARERDVEEAAIFRLNEFRKRFLNQQLKQLREQLTATTSSDEATIDRLQQQVAQIGRLKSAPPFERETVFAARS